MEWLNLHISLFTSPAYVGSAPVERATWLNLLAYCVHQENGGTILDCAEWKDRQWQQTCGVTLREVRAASKLLRFDGSNLVVNGYPLRKQEQVIRNRKSGTSGAFARWGKSGKQDGVAPAMADAMAPAITGANATTDETANADCECGRGRGRVKEYPLPPEGEGALPLSDTNPHRPGCENPHSTGACFGPCGCGQYHDCPARDLALKDQTDADLIRAKTIPDYPTSPAFLVFWAAYPARRRKDRKACAEYWRRKNLDAVAPAIMRHLEAQKLTTDWQKNDAQYVKDAIRYLRHSLWEDAAGVPAAAPQDAADAPSSPFAPVADDSLPLGESPPSAV